MASEITKDKYLSPDERRAQERMLQTLIDRGDRNALIFMLMLKTGARASEILSLQVSDIDTKENSVFIRGLKRSHSRAIYIKRPLMLKLMRYTNSLRATEVMFPISYVTLQKLWYEYRVVKKPLKSLRHTFAMEVLKLTGNIKTTQTALRHKSITSTMVYADHYSADEALRKARV